MKQRNITPRIKNNLGKILEDKGFPRRYGKFVLGDSFLQSINMSAIRFNRIVDNMEDMTVTEQHAIANKLGLEPSELLQTEEQVQENFGIAFTSPK
jgi:hypothetical protein